ncbi:hypothetical protein ACFOUP_15475 [Belliella kenyensis]|uniref:Uncharacterized protein n=1 Tax=Belliella kenyensis TaxID=1472724 RepID=A0ABV8EN97_9BACT|nr:hypothetical protein [Belliella kenyensis]MCH7402042.1 hypothetical protein [Belliella kenyensis]MDN3605206.1 hypothetical protein [Belliella kenyensis]
MLINHGLCPHRPLGFKDWTVRTQAKVGSLGFSSEDSGNGWNNQLVCEDTNQGEYTNQVEYIVQDDIIINED